MAKGEFVRIRRTETKKYYKVATPTGELYEVEDVEERKIPATDKIIGWRTETERVVYRMPYHMFLEMAEREV